MIDNIFGHLIEPEDCLARAKKNLDGVKHHFGRSPLDPIPGQPILLRLTTGGCNPYASARCYFTLDGSDPALPSAHRLDLEPVNTDWDELAWGYVCAWTVQLPPQPAGTLLRYHLAAQRSDTGTWTFADNQSDSVEKADDFALWIDNDPVPTWTSQALVYHVFIDRFFPGNGRSWNKTSGPGDFFGGTIRGVIDKLDYIQSLGFNTLWLSPFFKSSSHHGYNASDYYTVEPRLGTNRDVKELLEKAHARGLRMLLDFVANHWSNDHPTFLEAQKNPESPYHDWYTWKHWPDEYECYTDVKELPKINLKPGPARQYMLEVARHWLRAGFDGYRLDFAFGPAHDFWVDFRRACREIKSDCWIFGEVIHTPEMQRSYAGIFDGTLDFHLARALRETFAQQRMSLTEFEAFLSRHESYFPVGFSRPAFLDNHDMSRFLFLCNDSIAKLKLGALLLYTLSGPPIVYNGTESGVTQERPMQQGSHYVFEEARLPMKWGNAADQDLIHFFQQLARLRTAHPLIWKGTRRLVLLDEERKLYAYTLENETEKMLIAINLGHEKSWLEFQANGLASAHDQLYGSPCEFVDGVINIALDAQSGAFICS